MSRTFVSLHDNLVRREKKIDLNGFIIIIYRIIENAC